MKAKPPTSTKHRRRTVAKASRREGIVAQMKARETVGGVVDEREAAWATTGGGARRAPVGRAGATIADTFASLGHPVRIKVLTKLIEGPATYRSLQRLTKAKPGPLYHHLNQLRLSGLMLPKQRDLYELTRGGRNLIVGALALARLVRDSRRRPVAK